MMITYIEMNAIESSTMIKPRHRGGKDHMTEIEFKLCDAMECLAQALQRILHSTPPRTPGDAYDITAYYNACGIIASDMQELKDRASEITQSTKSC